MKKFIAGVMLGCLLSWGMSSMASPNLDHNGIFWSRLNGSAKSGYVTGYADAMEVSIGKLDNLSIAADLFRWKGARKIIHQLTRELEVSNANSDQLVKHLNELYANRKYNELDLGSALQLLTMSNGQQPQRSPDNDRQPAPAVK